MGFNIFGTEHTAEYLKKNHHIPAERVYKISEKQSPNVLEYLQEKKIDFIINIPRKFNRETVSDGFHIRRTATDFNVSLISNVQLAKEFRLTLKYVAVRRI